MTNEAAGKVTVVGLDKLLRKLDSKIPEHAKQRLYKKAGIEGQTHLAPTLPRHTGASASALSLSVSTESARISLPAKPLRFIEFGTQLTHGPGTRLHKRRTAAQWRGGTYRIAPRKFMAATRAWIKRQFPGWISVEEKAIESEWNS